MARYARYYNKIESIWDGKRYITVSVLPVEYRGSWAHAKGDDTAKAAEQQQENFNSQLMNIFQQQFGQQTQVLNYLKGKMQPMIDNPTGYDAATLAAMRTSATDTLSNNYQNAQKALQNQEYTSGGRDLPSGTSAQLNEALLNSEAADKSNAQNTITLNDANLKQQNYWNAVNVLNGTAAQFNPLGYASAATSGSGAVAGLSNAVTNSQNTGLTALLGGVAGGVFGAAGKAGGFSSLFS